MSISAQCSLLLYFDHQQI